MKKKPAAHSIHIGQRIREEIVRQQCDIAWLAQQIGCCRTNIYKIFTRESVDTGTLARISVALGHNFVADVAAIVDDMLRTASPQPNN